MTITNIKMGNILNSYLLVYQGGHSKKIKDLAAISPGVAVTVLILTLVIKTIHL